MEISVAILAGGRATRFGGADKASLTIGGRRIIERQLEAIAAVRPSIEDIRIVTGDGARYAHLGVRVVPDAVAGVGPLGGLYTALVDARHERVLVLACDLPFVTTGLVQRLEIESRAGEVDAVVPRSARGLEPLCAVYRSERAAAARACLDRGELKLTVFLAALRVRELDACGPDDDRTLFENVNTPHDYARARGLVEPDEKPFEDRITE